MTPAQIHLALAAILFLDFLVVLGFLAALRRAVVTPRVRVLSLGQAWALEHHELRELGL